MKSSTSEEKRDDEKSDVSKKEIKGNGACKE
jgi:hypothetical protein